MAQLQSGAGRSARPSVSSSLSRYTDLDTHVEKPEHLGEHRAAAAAARRAAGQRGSGSAAAARAAGAPEKRAAAAAWHRGARPAAAGRAGAAASHVHRVVRHQSAVLGGRVGPASLVPAGTGVRRQLQRHTPGTVRQKAASVNPNCRRWDVAHKSYSYRGSTAEVRLAALHRSSL